MVKPNSLILTRKRLLILFLSITFLFFGLFIRLFILQIIDGKELQAKGAGQWYRDLPLEAPRGKILDVNNEPLAENRAVFSIYARPNAVSDKRRASKILSEKLSLDYDKLLDKLTSSKVGEITVARLVPQEKINEIRKADLAGIYVSADNKRYYPLNNSLSQVIGFTNVDNVGQNGLEGYYDKYLQGVDGFSYLATDIKGHEIGDSLRYVPPIEGCTVTLSVDRHIQSFSEQAVNSAMEEWGSKNAEIIVMDVETGGIVAMASAPSFDLNNPPRDDLNILNALSKNKMIVDVYEPGSTFKIFTTAAALENNLVRESDRFFCPGYRIVDGKRIKCWRTIGHGSQNLIEGVMNSCNCVFMDLAGRLGVDRLYGGLTNFGFGSKTNIDFFGESKGLLMNKKIVKNVDLARIGFGQAVAVTPLQLLTGVCAVVGDGYLYEPYFMSQVTDYKGNLIYSREPKRVRKVVSDQTASLMRTMLGNVVAKGGGSKAKVDGYSIGGKTGTAQKYENGTIAQGKYISSFVGFAPLSNPKYAILMIVDEPTKGAYYGSIVAAPYAGSVFKKIFDYKKISPDQISEVKEEIVIPNLLGDGIGEAAATLKKLGIIAEIAGEGDKVTAMLPMPGSKIIKGDVILLSC